MEDLRKFIVDLKSTEEDFTVDFDRDFQDFRVFMVCYKVNVECIMDSAHPSSKERMRSNEGCALEII